MNGEEFSFSLVFILYANIKNNEVRKEIVTNFINGLKSKNIKYN